MTDEHKAALEEGRAEARIVKRYLTAIETAREKQQRIRRRPESVIRERLAEVETELAAARALRRLHLLQEKADLEEELQAAAEDSPDELEELRRRFIEVGRSYGERKGITYETWRQAGLDAQTLREAGISRLTDDCRLH